jgi:hypothetical protein
LVPALAFFMDLGQLEGHHAVVRLQEELFEFGGSVCPRARFADARLYLFPVSHGGDSNSVNTCGARKSHWREAFTALLPPATRGIILERLQPINTLV